MSESQKPKTMLLIGTPEFTDPIAPETGDYELGQQTLRVQVVHSYEELQAAERGHDHFDFILVASAIDQAKDSIRSYFFPSEVGKKAQGIGPLHQRNHTDGVCHFAVLANFVADDEHSLRVEYDPTLAALLKQKGVFVLPLEVITVWLSFPDQVESAWTPVLEELLGSGKELYVSSRAVIKAQKEVQAVTDLRSPEEKLWDGYGR